MIRRGNQCNAVFNLIRRYPHTRLLVNLASVLGRNFKVSLTLSVARYMGKRHALEAEQATDLRRGHA